MKNVSLLFLSFSIPVDRFTPQAKAEVQELLSFTVQTQDMMAATLYDHQLEKV